MAIKSRSKEFYKAARHKKKKLKRAYLFILETSFAKNHVLDVVTVAMLLFKRNEHPVHLLCMSFGEMIQCILINLPRSFKLPTHTHTHTHIRETNTLVFRKSLVARGTYFFGSFFELGEGYEEGGLMSEFCEVTEGFFEDLAGSS